MNKIRILQLGDQDWNKIFTLPETVILDHVDVLAAVPAAAYDLCFLDRTPTGEEAKLLSQSIRAYTLFVTDKVELIGETAWLCKSRGAQSIAAAEVQRFLLQETSYYYAGSYGEKLELRDLSVNRGFNGTVRWNGNCGVVLTGEFGNSFRQAAFWRFNSYAARGETHDLWLEYKKEGTVEIALEVIEFADGTAETVLNRWLFDEAQLGQVVRIESRHGNGNLFFSIRARGTGVLQIIALHKRLSRGSHGYFLPGGERYVTADREELFAYFEPGDLRPPLNVYFAGYKTLQGFEGYFRMKSMGCPFLLLSEPRLEGGCLYVGTREYETMLLDVVRKYMTKLGFGPDQVILSGISGGSYGALYYGCDLKPHAVIVGKPVPSLGSVAANEKLLRPDGLPATLDMLRYLSGNLDEASVAGLNVRFWKKFDAADWGKSKFIIAYMIEDDYDPDGYEMLISHLWSSGVQVYGKGIHGRHNDNTPAVVSWVFSQYHKVLEEDFARRIGR